MWPAIIQGLGTLGAGVLNFLGTKNASDIQSKALAAQNDLLKAQWEEQKKDLEYRRSQRDINAKNINDALYETYANPKRKNDFYSLGGLNGQRSSNGMV